jgi:two-component system response regulator AtoC
MKSTCALVVEDEPDIRAGLVRQLQRAGIGEVLHEASGADALATVRRHQVDVVLLDLGLPDRDGLELIPEFLAFDPEVRILVLTGRDDARDAVRALQAGARNYLIKPCDREELAVMVRRAVEERQLRNQAELARRLSSTGTSMATCRSAAWTHVMALATDVARTSHAHVILRGESGVGKEVVARAIHAASPRSHRPFVASNVASLPASLIESELFGHEAGAFTGARSHRRGLFELAQHGTLFLDEIGEMPLELQSRLLRVLEGQPFRRLGGEREVAVDVRIVSATHRDLEAMVHAKVFRADLLYRLRVIELAIPPLRERPEDVATLADHFAAQIALVSGRPRLELSPEARRQLERYPWPGNVRELRNVIERGAVLAREGRLELDHLPAEIARPRTPGLAPARARSLGEPATAPGEGPDLRLEAAIQRHITSVWARFDHNLSRTARALDLSRVALRKRLRAYGLLDGTDGTTGDLPTGDLPVDDTTRDLCTEDLTTTDLVTGDLTLDAEGRAPAPIDGPPLVTNEPVVTDEPHGHAAPGPRPTTSAA